MSDATEFVRDEWVTGHWLILRSTSADGDRSLQYRVNVFELLLAPEMDREAIKEDYYIYLENKMRS